MRYGSTNMSITVYKENNLVNFNIKDIEEYLLEFGDIREAPPTTHSFSDGVYVREITMDKDTIILGAEHLTTHFNIISKGSCMLLDPDTGNVTHLEAPCTFESKAGVQKLLHILEDCVWATIHVTEETDVSKLENMLFKDFKKLTEKRKELSK